MKTNIKRRIMLGTAVAAIGVGPFVIRHFRKAQSLPESAWIDKVPSAMSSSGYLSVAEANFSPLALPHATDIQHSSIAACLSTDQDLVLFSYSYGNDWNVRLCYAPLSPQGVIGNFETLLDIKRPQSIITGIGCSGIKSGKISFVLRQCEPDDHDRTQCKESLFFANLVKSRQCGYSLSINDTDNGYSNPNRFLVMKRGFTALVNSNHHHWAQGTDLFFFGGRKGVDRFSPDENKPSGYTKKVISDFGESEYGSNGKQNSPSVPLH